MKTKFLGLFAVIIAILAVITTGCTGPAGPAGPAGADGTNAAATCSDCHNSGMTLVAIQHEYAASGHASGSTALAHEASASCAGCHTGQGLPSRVDASGNVAAAAPEAIEGPAPINCRTCHQIHETYTSDDWAFTTTAPVSLISTGDTYDAGEGNLCAECHQARTPMPDTTPATFEVTSTHWGAHHGPQSNLVMGVGGYTGTSSTAPSPGAHYSMTDNSCVTCHMGEADGNVEGGHTWNPSVANCVQCHADATSFDINGVQTEVQGMLDDLKGSLVAAGMLTASNDSPVPGTYDSVKAAALYNYLYVEQDRSLGVHNPSYVKKILQAGIDAMK
jgi:hypothetical protein